MPVSATARPASDSSVNRIIDVCEIRRMPKRRTKKPLAKLGDGDAAGCSRKGQRQPVAEAIDLAETSAARS